MFEEYQNDLELDRMSTSMWFVLSVFWPKPKLIIKKYTNC
jgi:hypothetical protein